MRDCAIVWIAGVPRVGSMWAFNVARELVAHAGFRVLPHQALSDRDEILSTAARALSEDNRQQRWVFKLHDLLNPALDRSLFIVPQRDPRDTMLSAWRFLRLADFEAALAFIFLSLGTLDHYADAAFADRKLTLDYRLIVDDPAAAVMGIARFLDVAIEASKIEDIVRKLTKAAVARRVGELEAGAPSVRQVSNADGSHRLFDTATGFQSGHVSDYREGDWRRLLTERQLAQVDARLGPWLAAHGYPPTLAEGSAPQNWK